MLSIRYHRLRKTTNLSLAAWSRSWRPVAFIPVSTRRGSMQVPVKRVYVVGTADTKGQELDYVRALVHECGVPAVLVDVGIRPATVAVDVPARAVAAFHPQGADHVLGSGDRGSAV